MSKLRLNSTRQIPLSHTTHRRAKNAGNAGTPFHREGRPTMSQRLLLIVTPVALLAASAAPGEDAYYEVRLDQLPLIEGALPTQPCQFDWLARHRWQALEPYAALDSDGEIYLTFEEASPSRWADYQAIIDDADVAIRAPEGRDVTGRLFLPNPDWLCRRDSDSSPMIVLKFELPAASTDPEAHKTFHESKQKHYARLLQRRIPGAAWFRHQTRQARIALIGRTDTDIADLPTPIVGRTGQLSDTYALLSGGRAMSENLQLDRILLTTRPDEPTVDVDSITGITVREFDWQALTQDMTPDLDPLARLIPADQHVMFFPSFQNVLKMTDESTDFGTPVLRVMDPRSETARTRERYERQLCLPLNTLVRLLGPKMVRSVALTGSDPYYRTGTDVAVLLETPQPEALHELLLAQVSLLSKAHPDAEAIRGEEAGLSYAGARSPDRSVCSYVARLDGAAVVTNSPHQLKRLAAVHDGESPALTSLPEYTFFRQRYPLGDDDETALLFLSDATIRRWCGPKWRVASSRRTRAAAVLAELTASHVNGLVTKTVEPGAIHTDWFIPDAGKLRLTPQGVISSTYGSLEYLTPIAELPINKVTEAEAQAYRRWRDTYQWNWRQFFDPIAIRFSVRDDRVAMDLSVLPLILATEYNEFVRFTQGAEIAPHAGDPHDALLHAALSVNREAPMMKTATSLLQGLLKMFGVDPLSWLGQSIALYADDDPFWRELADIDVEHLDGFMQAHMHRLPIAVHLEVISAAKLTVFLTAFRAYIEQTAPGMCTWHNLIYKEQPYVKVTPTESAKTGEPQLEKLAVYYCPTPDALTLTLNEDVLKRAIDRRVTRRAAGEQGNETLRPGKPWLGRNICLQIDRKLLDGLHKIIGENYQTVMQARAWGNLPILNEWKRMYPDRDPVQVHERLWNTRLVCPGGGEYVWNEEWQTMESTVYGHPGVPKDGPPMPPKVDEFVSGNFGLTFEEDGLRARVSLKRQTPAR